MGIEDLIKDDSSTKITDEALGSLGETAGNLVRKMKEIEAAEDSLKKLKAEAREMSEVDIPGLMDDLGMDKITLKSGHVVSVADAIHCAIPASKRPGAHSWLEQHGHGDIVKATLSAKFSKGEKAEATAAQNALLNMGISSSVNESVHAGTLKAWAREELAKGRALPEEFFKVHVGRVTKIS